MRGSRTARRALARRASAAALAGAAALWSAGQLAAAQSIRDHWEATEPVIVTTRAVAAGEELGAENTESQHRPASHVPDGAADRIPPGARTLTAHVAGEIVLEDRIGKGPSLAGSVPPGTSAVSIAVEAPLPPLGVGDHVRLVAASTEPDGTPGGARTIAADAVVVDVSEPTEWTGASTLTVAVAERRSAEVAAAVLAGPVAVVLEPASSG